MSFVQIFDLFICERCIQEEHLKVSVSNLHQKFNEWCVAHNYCKWGTKSFSQHIKNSYPQFKHERISIGMIFNGICLQENYVPSNTSPNTEDKILKNKLYKQQHYVQHREQYKQRSRESKEIIKQLDRILMDKVHITSDQVRNRKLKGLLKYITEDNTKLISIDNIDWNETIRRMNANIQEYHQQQNTKTSKTLHQYNKTIKCHQDNIERRINNTNNLIISMAKRDIGLNDHQQLSQEQHNIVSDKVEELKQEYNICQDQSKLDRKLIKTIRNTQHQVIKRLHQKFNNVGLSLDPTEIFIDEPKISPDNFTISDYESYEIWHSNKDCFIRNLNICDTDKCYLLNLLNQKYEHISERYDLLYP